MNRENVVAERYARALFIIAERRGEILEALEDLKRLRGLIRSDARLDRFLRSPLVPLERKRALIGADLSARVIEPVARFMDLLLRKKRVSLISGMVDEYETLVRRWQGLEEAEAVSAVALTGDEVKRLHVELERMTGKTIELATSVDAALIGGLYVRIGDRIMDRSVRGLLASLQERLSEVSLQASGD
jgi:F-type H+-transporting ATPase subunit delta